MSNLLLDIPERFTWATGASRIVDPVTAGYTLATGYDYSQKPPPKTENYFRNLQYRMYDTMLTQNLSAWFEHTSTTLSGLALYNIARNNYSGNFVVTTSAGGSHYSRDGISWSANVAMPHTPSIRNAIYDGSGAGKIILGSSSTAFIVYTTTGLSWTSVASTGTNTLVNRGDDTFFIALDGASGTVWLWLTGITGVRTAATLSPVGLTALARGCAGDSANNWYIADTANTFISTDDADTWAATSGSLGVITTAYATDYEDGTWIVAGEDGSFNGTIEYSTDEGANWSAGTIHYSSLAGTTTLKDVRALGNDMWVACGSSGTIGRDFRPNIIISMDDGVNWYPVAASFGDGAALDFGALWCDGSRIASVDSVSGIVTMNSPLVLDLP